MRGLVASFLALALGACTVTISPAPPSIWNLWSQDWYCTHRTTRVDFGFSFSGVLTRLEVYLLDEGQKPWEARPGQKVADLDTLIVGSGEVRGYVDVTPAQTQQALGPQGIIVEPVGNKVLWVRGFNGSAASAYVESSVVMFPDNTNVCDPGETAP
ncbi:MULTISPECIES: hypothetical protein [Thermus]|jgi:hypothetical protein|uniref:Lipoprotein n=1 Tax=Thermus thermophilus (strain ATCC 27634 / DSM 579 / HB8) TaxID=300852 RepID=Q5SK56_THET8|nr:MULTISPECIES: hypothetical protein [Thermus]QZY59287.1 hypothetical protein K7H19_04095 [Thermus thermophilus]BAD70619.1 hypothetical protein [Thermus thermophilus HB8]HAH39527.1 hypothetical protein [Thermus sp.]